MHPGTPGRRGLREQAEDGRRSPLGRGGPGLTVRSLWATRMNRGGLPRAIPDGDLPLTAQSDGVAGPVRVVTGVAAGRASGGGGGQRAGAAWGAADASRRGLRLASSTCGDQAKPLRHAMHVDVSVAHDLPPSQRRRARTHSEPRRARPHGVLTGRRCAMRALVAAWHTDDEAALDRPAVSGSASTTGSSRSLRTIPT